MKNYDVVVIGFGPVGQMPSAQLGQAGHSVAAFEAYETLYGLSRAGHMDDEIVRTLQKIGIDEEFKSDAVPWDMYDMRTKAFDGELLLRMDWSQVGPHGHRGHWIFYQNYLELAMHRAVTETGNVDITMGTKAVGFEQDDDGVTITLEHRKSGEQTQVRAKYLIAADGANSSIRERLGIKTWVGNCDYNQLVVDCREKHKLNFEFDNGQFADPERPGCLFQLGAHHHRWEWTLLPGEKPEDFTEERVWELLKPWVGPDDVEILRRPVYNFREVVAEHWQDGRVFLAGDSAHHVVGWATEALDAIRRQAWTDARRVGHTRSHGWINGRRSTVSIGSARALLRSRYALWKNPEDLTDPSTREAPLDRIYRSSGLPCLPGQRGLWTVFKLPSDQDVEALERWVQWARRSRIESFVTLPHRVGTHREQIHAAIEHGLSNGLVESMNTKIRLITRIAFGFVRSEALHFLCSFTPSRNLSFESRSSTRGLTSTRS
ncbi:hypothetical protein BH93_22765 [Rhodococcoides fascians A25f]|uniref:FAD-dependent monooxygenase n=1 Tax=Rhodococcoides fascians TaxID=1828 RepID=UPI00068DC521|nr:FAD-dependent monooxygenase [Rhodococcus fascians]QII07820.1 hypothetical protein BH93_22765 [Rhodococcus fascians A25f]